MTSLPKISRGQLVALLLAGRLSGCLLFSSESFERFTLTECLLSTLLNGVFIFLLLLPTLLLLRRDEIGTIGYANRLSGRAGRVVELLYLPLCVFVLGTDLVQFSDFAQKTLPSHLSLPVLTVVFIAFCVAASFYGIQALARASTVVAVFALVCLSVLVLALIPEMRAINFPPPQGNGAMRIFQKAITDLPRTTEVVAIGLLYPYVNGGRTVPCAAFAGATAVASAAVSVAAVAVLGDFSGMVAYPFYAAVASVRIGVFQRPDILVVAVWLGTFFVRFTLFCLLFVDRARHLFGKRAAIPSGMILFVILSGVALWVQNGVAIPASLLTKLYWWMLGGTCLWRPTLLWLGGKRHEKA